MVNFSTMVRTQDKDILESKREVSLQRNVHVLSNFQSYPSLRKLMQRTDENQFHVFTNNDVLCFVFCLEQNAEMRQGLGHYVLFTR